MGWYKVCKLEIAGGWEESGVPDGPAMWSRGGLEGVVVQDTSGKFINIPRGAILDLIAVEYRRKQLSRLDQMDTQECLREMGL